MNIFNHVFLKNNYQKFYENIRYINLDHRTDRLHHINNELKNIGLIGKKFIAHFGNKGYGARIACKNSHKDIIQESLFNNIDTVFILEDDSVFADNFLEISEHCFKNIPEDWDILFLGHCFSSVGNQISEHVYSAKKIFCTHAYLVNIKAYQTIIDALNNSNQPIDHIYNRLAVNNNINVYMCNPSIVYQIPNKSDIGEGPNNSNNLINND